ncbi:hypothetical protein EBT31_10635 [bacterium]|nr:hypothetical protein [bacterium]
MSWDKSKLTHNLNPGDKVRVKGFKMVAEVIELNPHENWENCVILSKPLRGWTYWDAHDLEKVTQEQTKNDPSRR